MLSWGKADWSTGRAAVSSLLKGVRKRRNRARFGLQLEHLEERTLLSASPLSTEGALDAPLTNIDGESALDDGPDLFDTAGTTSSVGSNAAVNNMQPSLTMNYIIAITGLFPSQNDASGSDISVSDSTPFLAEIRPWASNFAPAGWAFAQGQILSINSNQSLFSLLGTTYGGDGVTTFALPDLRGRVPVHPGNGITLGQTGGGETVSLAANNIPAHNHNLLNGGAATSTVAGGSQAVNNMQPYLGINHIIAVQGEYPSPSDSQPFVAEVVMFAGNFAPVGWAFTNGQLLSIASNTALYSLVGTNFGGNGETTFGLPDLRGRSAVGSGTGPGLSNVALGQTFGTSTSTITQTNLPMHAHEIGTPDAMPDTTSAGGSSTPINNQMPSLGLNWIFPLTGTFPSQNDADPLLSRMSLFAGNFAPAGWALAQGQLLSIASNQSVFSLIGTTYGGDGESTFALPDLRGRVGIGSGTGSGLTSRILGQKTGANTVTLSVNNLPAHTHDLPGTSIMIDVDDNLLIEDSLGITSDTLTMVIDGTNIRISDPNVPLLAGTGTTLDNNDVLVPIASILGDIFINLLDGDDSLKINFSGGSFTKAIHYDGGDQDTIGDSLTLMGGTFADATFNFTNENDGTIQLTGQGLITYTGLEPITSSIAATNVTLNYSDTSETITVSDAGSGQTTVDSNVAGEMVTFNNPTGTLMINAGDTGINTINVGALAATYSATLDINGGDAGDTVNLNGAIAFADHKSLLVDALTINAPNATSDIATTGTGSVVLTATGNILLSSGASLTTVDGGITLDANPTGAQTADFIGLEANNVVIQTTGTGNLLLQGKGAETGNDTSQMYGVYLHDGTSVSSTATGSSAGTITITGTGGDGTFNNYGVFLNDDSTDVTSVDGNILITGQGGDGSSNNNFGVFLDQIEKIESSGTGTEAATITINGTGGDGLGANVGVHLQGDTVKVTSVDGDISITGTGGDGSNSYNDGVRLSNIETIESTGMGANAATITINGTGGDGISSNYGVRLSGSSTDVTSVDGTVTITGTGGAGSGDNNHGIYLTSDPTVQVTTGLLTISGTAGAGNSHGVDLDVSSGGRLVSTGTGNIIVTAEGNGTQLDFQAGADSLIGGPTATGNITINADSVALTGTTNVQSSGALTIQPRTASTAINLGTGATDSGLQLTDVELAFLADGFNSITIGDVTNGTGLVNIFPSIFLDPVTIAGGTIHDNSGTDITAPSLTLDGNVSPGQSPGVLVVNGNLSLATNSTYSVELTGLASGGAGTTFDQIDVTGTVTIDPTATFALLSAVSIGGVGTEVVLINNDNSDAVIGTFNNLLEGSVVTTGGFDFTISYVGGDGNDVVLIVPEIDDVFAYDGTTGDIALGQSNGSAFSFASGPNWDPADGWKLFAGDFNGDGLQDVAGFRTAGANAGRWQLGLSNGSTLITTNSLYWSSTAGWDDFHVGDYNGDGKDDVAARNSAGQWWMVSGNGTGFSSSSFASWNPSGWVGTTSGDFNNDGKDDIAGLDQAGQWWVGFSNGTNLLTSYAGKWTAQATAGWHNILSGDFNTDGKADIVAQTASGRWYFATSTGAAIGTLPGSQRFATFVGNQWSTTAGFNEILVGDFDGDGRDDLASRTSAGGWWVQRSLGTSAATSYWGSWGTAQNWSAIAGDYNGDGRDDIAGIDATTGNWFVSLSQTTNFQQQYFGNSPLLTDPVFLGRGKILQDD